MKNEPVGTEKKNKNIIKNKKYNLDIEEIKKAN